MDYIFKNPVWDPSTEFVCAKRPVRPSTYDTKRFTDAQRAALALARSREIQDQLESNPFNSPPVDIPVAYTPKKRYRGYKPDPVPDIIRSGENTRLNSLTSELVKVPFDVQVEVRSHKKELHVLSFCDDDAADAISDISFACEDRGFSGKLVVDSYDPDTPIHIDARRPAADINVGGKDFRGTLYPAFKEGFYDLILGYHSFAWLTHVSDEVGSFPRIVLESLTNDGVFVGSYYDVRSAASANDSFVQHASSVNFQVHRLLTMEATEPPEALLQTPAGISVEPYTTALIQERTWYRYGGNLMVYSAADVKVFEPDMCRRNRIPNLFRVDFDCVRICVLRKASSNFRRSWRFTESLGVQEDLISGETPNISVYCAGVSFLPVKRRQFYELALGELTLITPRDSSALYIYVIYRNFTLFLYGYCGVQSKTGFTFDGSYIMQAEQSKGRYVFRRLFYLNGNPVTYGYGLTHAYAFRDDAGSPFNFFDYKDVQQVSGDFDFEDGTEYYFNKYCSPPPVLVRTDFGPFNPALERSQVSYFSQSKKTFHLHRREMHKRRRTLTCIENGYTYRYSGPYLDAPFFEFELRGNFVDHKVDPNEVHSTFLDTYDSFSLRHVIELLHYNCLRYTDLGDDVQPFPHLRNFTAIDFLRLVATYPRPIKIPQASRYVALVIRSALYRRPSYGRYVGYLTGVSDLVVGEHHLEAV